MVEKILENNSPIFLSKSEQMPLPSNRELYRDLLDSGTIKLYNGKISAIIRDNQGNRIIYFKGKV